MPREPRRRSFRRPSFSMKGTVAAMASAFTREARRVPRTGFESPAAAKKDVE
jgi:hypothetical protein